MEPTLVYIDEYGLRGTNFYWHKYEGKGLSKQDVLDAGLTSDRVQVHADIIERLMAIDTVFQTKGYVMFIRRDIDQKHYIKSCTRGGWRSLGRKKQIG